VRCGISLLSVTNDRYVMGDYIYTYSAGATNPRQEILFQMDPLLAPRGNRLNTSAFDNRIQAGIRSGSWKLIVGEPGE
jgi:hypothetical protein